MCKFANIIFGLVMCTSLPYVCAHEVRLPESLEQLSLERVSEDVYVVHGMQSFPDKENLGFMSNTGVVLTDNGVVVIDSGGSLQVGRQIIKRIGELTDKPVIAVFNSHIHGDHWLGNAAFREAYPQVRIYAHNKAIARLDQGEAEQYLDIFMRITEKAVAGTTAVLPDHGLKGGENLDFTGFRINVHHTGHAHTDSDIMLEIPGRRVLFAGDIIEYGRAVSSDVPRDFDAMGQISAIRYALALPVDTYVPGHGVSGGREVAEAALRFLEVLYGSVKKYYEAGLSDYEMQKQVRQDMAAFSDWYNMSELGRLISFVYLQVEKADFQ